MTGKTYYMIVGCYDEDDRPNQEIITTSEKRRDIYTDYTKIVTGIATLETTCVLTDGSVVAIKDLILLKIVKAVDIEVKK